MPTTPKTSVLYLIVLLFIVVTPLAYFQHKGDSLALRSIYQEGLVIEQANAQEKTGTQINPVSPTPAPIDPKTKEQKEVVAFIEETFGEDAEDALQVARCESGFNPRAVNHNTDANQTTDYGVFQINDHWQGVDNTNFLFEYKINVLMAKEIFDGRGNWSAWVCAQKMGI